MSARPPRNLLFIMSDEHNKRVLGAAGHPMIRTPNLDRLAAGGVRFTDAYCNSPICVPSRASFQTGRYVHDIRFWDNAIPYDGSVPSWAHRLEVPGIVSIPSASCTSVPPTTTTGSPWSIIPLHVVDGVGDPVGMLRDPLPRRDATLRLAAQAGKGESDLPALRRSHHRDRGSVAAPGAPRSRMTSRGACSSRWCARISR